MAAFICLHRMLLFHRLPMEMADFIVCRIAGKKLPLRKMYDRMTTGLDVLRFFFHQDWDFVRSNAIDLQKSLSETDRYVSNCTPGLYRTGQSKPVGSCPAHVYSVQMSFKLLSDMQINIHKLTLFTTKKKKRKIRLSRNVVIFSQCLVSAFPASCPRRF